MTWAERNAAYLRGEIARVAALLAGSAPIERAAVTGDDALALVALERLFRLSPFEYDIVVMCAGAALDPAIGTLLGGRPSFAKALAQLRGGHLDVASPGAPLRAYRMIHLAPGEPVLTASMWLDERILHFVLGTPALDERLAPLLSTKREHETLVTSHRQLVSRLARMLEPAGLPKAVVVFGGDASTRAAVLREAATTARLVPLSLRASALVPGDLDLIARLCERETMLGNALPIVEIDDHDPADAVRAARTLADLARGLIVISHREAIALSRGVATQLEVPATTAVDRREVWTALLGEERLAPTIERLADQFRIGHADISSVVLACDRTAETSELAEQLWTGCLERTRSRIDEQARRIVPSASWNDLVVPASVGATLREIVEHLRHHHAVHERWGFARGQTRGNAITALFAGPSGTGKTMAAEVLAREAKLDLYHVDLSQIVDKYVGETEKRLRRIFDAAEHGGAILLFDEADALFGKRAGIERASDRWANVEVSYLLQRMESYHGLAILTTNAKDAIDHAFLRRLRFVATFPFPDPALRIELWRRAFPPDAPTSGLDLERLARLQLSGANIKTIALKAAFHAASDATAIKQHHVVRAARSEFAKLDVPFPESVFAS